MDLKTILTSQWFSLVLVLVIIAIGVWVGYLYFKQQKWVEDSLNSVKNELNELSPNIVDVYDELGPENQLVKGSKALYAKIQEILGQSVLVDDIKTMSEYAYSDSRNNSGESALFLTRPLSDIVDGDYFSENKVFSNFIKSSPSLFTGLGLLGTFFGLSIGLYYSQNNTGGDVLTGITNMLAGSGSAFYTSLVGICISLVLTGMINYKKDKIRSEYNHIMSVISTLVPVKPYEILIAEQVGIAKEEREDMNHIFEQLAIKLSEKMSGVYKNDIVPFLADMKSDMSAIVDKMDEANKSLEALSNSGGKAIGDVVSGVAGAQIRELAKIIEEVKKTLEDSNESNKQMLAQQERMLATMQQTVDALNEQIKNSSTAMTVELMKTMKNISDMMEKLVHQLTTEGTKTIGDLNTAVSEAIIQLNKNQQDLVEKIAKLTAGIDEISDKLVGTSYDLFTDITDMVKLLLKNVEESMKNVKGIAKEVEEAMNAASEGNKDLQNASKEVKAAIADIIKSQNNFAVQSVELTNNFVEAIKSTENTSKNMVKHGEEVEKHIEEYKQAYTLLATKMHKTMEAAADRIEAMQERFGKAALQLQTNMQDKVNVIEDSTVTVLKEFDKHTANLCEQLTSVVRAMGDTSESFIDQMNKLSANKGKGTR